MKKIFILALAAFGVVACASDKANISGDFAANPNTTVYVESVGEGGINHVDSVQTNSAGRFSLRLKKHSGKVMLVDFMVYSILKNY